MRYLLGRVACFLEMHDYQTIRPHWLHSCHLTMQQCTRCKAVR